MQNSIRHTKGHLSTFRTGNPITNEQIALYAPSILQESRHESRSDRYTQIPTIAVVEAMRREGFHPFEIMQARTRIEGKREFAKHLIRFRHISTLGVERPEYSEIISVNAHDGGAAWSMMGGQFRTVCSNGLICWTDGTECIRIQHRGNVIDRVIEGAYQVLEDVKRIEDHRDNMKAITLSRPEQEVFAEQAITLRYDTVEQSPVTVAQVLQANRSADLHNDLWTSFNRVQENLVRGGQRFVRETGHRARTRAVTGIDQSVKLNQALWALAEKMAQLKTA